ncbi:MAG: hypothetical protein JST38_05795 [Bacteroidetes bacterium]|nr:hypothetical protein [Bacteroidota bacterium]MBS1940372.1 hypothetical protein [Bacteroidota bacterium]
MEVLLVRRKNRYLPEWSLFMLVAVLSWRVAWAIGEGNTTDFFRQASDGLGYYQWLPATFITGDLAMMPWTHLLSGDRAISLFTLGVAVLQLPFFLLAEWFTWVFGYPDTGYNPANAVCMMASTAAYAGAGAVFSFKLACRYGTAQAALLAVVAIYAGSNIFYYATDKVLMSHVYSYFLVSLFCWTGLRIIDGPRRMHVFLFIFSGALMVLVRQLNVVVLFFPLWMAWRSPGGGCGTLRNMGRHRGTLIAAVLMGAVPWVLQSMYWHYITGHWYANGYAYKDEFFDFSRMVPGMVLFSPRNGWFVFSPIFLFVVGGLLVQAWRGRRPARPILLVLLLTLLLYSAWWSWWLGGAYGHRGFVDLYGLLAIPLAWLFRSVMRSSWAVRIFSALLLYALVRLNFGMIGHFDNTWYTEASTWPRVLEAVGEIAAGK